MAGLYGQGFCFPNLSDKLSYFFPNLRSLVKFLELQVTGLLNF